VFARCPFFQPTQPLTTPLTTTHFTTRHETEVDEVLGDRIPNLADIKAMQLVRMSIAETLRMYPEPPLLIRRALEDHSLPKGTAAFEPRIMRGADIFISVYNLHRDPQLWPQPDTFDPERFLRPYSNKAVHPDWEGYDPAQSTGLYPNEVSADFAFLPFGGGARKCVGDQFATLEATVALAMLMRRFEFDFVGSPADVGMKTGATIHTRNGLIMRPRKRVLPAQPAAAAPVPAARELQTQGA
jgi:cytochrome P450 family 97 subfamily B polypeptide 3